MKDEKGLFYYPFPENKKVRMYVQEDETDVWFRLWNQDDEKLWEEHGWVPYGAIKKAAASYENKKAFDPGQAYDINVAKMIIKEGNK
ncbi:MAG: hypothetical protein ACNI3A_18250 [Desulfovibrio sp.]|uniref:hypothetical protein n=1 Tax=Desulfovibrio sp. 7SRBS1 TaxID=3378064 RepID=UPI003B3E81C5